MDDTAFNAVITAHPQLRLLDVVREQMRVKYYSLRTEDTSVGWIKCFILFHNKHHPAELGERDISAFVTHLAVEKHVLASTQNQALASIVFHYKHIPERELADLWITGMNTNPLFDVYTLPARRPFSPTKPSGR